MDLFASSAVGFFVSIMFPTIYGLATNSFDKAYSSPNWDAGFIVAFACYAYIFAIGIFAKTKN